MVTLARFSYFIRNRNGPKCTKIITNKKHTPNIIKNVSYKCRDKNTYTYLRLKHIFSKMLIFCSEMFDTKMVT